MTPQDRETFFARLAAQRPAPTTELVHANPFELVVAVMLSAQTTDVSVNRATGPLFAVASTPEAILAVGEERLIDYLKYVNFHRTKAKNLTALCRRLIEVFGGEVPTTQEDLESLPGVGRKTALVVRNTAFGQETIAVDTHIFRVSNRTGLAPGKDVRAVEDALEHVTPKAYRRYAHHWLLLHGRYTCRARQPDCPGCLVAELCAWPDKTVA